MEAALLHIVAVLFPAKVSEKDPINTLSSTSPAASAEMERPNSDASGSNKHMIFTFLMASNRKESSD